MLGLLSVKIYILNIFYIFSLLQTKHICPCIGPIACLLGHSHQGLLCSSELAAINSRSRISLTTLLLLHCKTRI